MQIGRPHPFRYELCKGREHDKEVAIRKLTVLLVALALSLGAIPAATAHGAGLARGELEGGSMPNFDSEAVAARCPEGFEWILQTFGSSDTASTEMTAPASLQVPQDGGYFWARTRPDTRSSDSSDGSPPRTDGV